MGGYSGGTCSGIEKYLSLAIEEVRLHLQKMNLNPGCKVVYNPSNMDCPDSYLFVSSYFTSWGFSEEMEIYVPRAELTSDGMLHFFTGVSSVDLKVSKTKILEALLDSDTL